MANWHKYESCRFLIEQAIELETRPGTVISLFALFLLAFALRLIRLFDLDLCFDEAVLLLPLNHSFAEIWNIFKTDNFTPLFPWFVKLWGSFSRDVGWFRLLAALLGSLTPPLAFLLGYELKDKKLAWLLGIGTAISVGLIFYSQLIRMVNIQPFLACLSLWGFIKAIKTDRWRYWMITSLANLLGFYVYYFWIFLFLAELLILSYHFRLDFRHYRRALIAHIPFFIGILIMLGPLWQRYTQVEAGFAIPPFEWADLVKLWLFLGTGSDFRDTYWLAFILNLPFLIGFLLALPLWPRNLEMRITISASAIVVLIFWLFSQFGQSFFKTSYFTFILPFYLAIVLVGWLRLSKSHWRIVGTGLVLLSLIGSLLYYYVDYYDAHYYYSFVRRIPYAEKGEGHNLSLTVREVADRLQNDEVIVHYSVPHVRKICSFFASLYYHRRAFPEYIYSKSELESYNGRQYLQPGERISSLRDLQPLPAGLWMISLGSTEAFFNKAAIGKLNLRHGWNYEENFPDELVEAGYRCVETLQHGQVTAMHFRRSEATGRPD